jgi:hypothetical protein
LRNSAVVDLAESVDGQYILHSEDEAFAELVMVDSIFDMLDP